MKRGGLGSRIRKSYAGLGTPKSKPLGLGATYARPGIKTKKIKK